MLVDSKKKQLGVEPIIILGSEETDTDLPPATIYASVVAELNQPGATLFQEGNTLFIIHHLGPREGFFKIINADTSKNYLENFYTFTQAAHRFGYDVLHSEFSNPDTLNLYRAIAKNPPMPNMHYSVEKTDDGIGVTLQLGDPREK